MLRAFRHQNFGGHPIDRKCPAKMRRTNTTSDPATQKTLSLCHSLASDLFFFFPLLFFFFFCVCRAFELTSSSSSFQCWHWPKCSGGLDLFDGRSFLPSFLPPLQRRRRKTSLVVKTRRGTHRSMSKSQLLLFCFVFYINGLSGLAESVRFRCVFVLTGEKSCPNDCGAGRETVGCDASSQPNC